MEFIQHYNQIKKKKKIRDFLREIALDFLSIKSNLLNEHKFLKKPRIQFIYLHHFFKDELQNLENLIIWLSQNHTFISYSEAVNKIVNSQIDKPYIVFSSDDGFKNISWEDFGL